MTSCKAITKILCGTNWWFSLQLLFGSHGSPPPNANNEQHVQKLITLNRKEETDLQRKLDQLQREQNQLRREFDQDIRKTRKAFNTSKKIPPPADDSTSRVRRNSLPSVKPIKTTTNAKRRHSIACTPSASMVEEEERDDNKADEDVMFEIDNSFRFLSIAFGNKPSTPTSSNTVKLPEIQSSYSRGSSSSFKPPLMRRRQSEVITLRHDDKKKGGLFPPRPQAPKPGERPWERGYIIRTKFP